MRANKLLCLLEGGRPETLPVYVTAAGFSLRYQGLPLAGAWRRVEELFAAQQRTFAAYGFDGIPEYGYTTYFPTGPSSSLENTAAAFAHLPAHGEPPIKSEKDLCKLHLPGTKANVLIQSALAFSRLQRREGLPALVVLGGPLTVAATLCPLELMCAWLVERGPLFQRLMQRAFLFLQEIIAQWVETFGARWVLPKIHEPLASNDLISPEQFRSHVLPTLQKLSSWALSLGIPHLFYHICGNQSRNLAHWSRVPMGAGVVSVGHEVDLAQAIACFPERCIVAGNIAPALLQAGPAVAIREAARACTKVARQAQGRFVLAPGGEVLVDTPPAHMRELARAMY